MSPRSQNDIVSLFGFDIIRDRILKEVMDAKFFLFWQTKCAARMWSTWLFALDLLIFSGQIREEFISFIKMVRVRAVDIEEANTKQLTDISLSFYYLHGQGYDGASTTSGENSGVQKRILDKQPKALYTHCSGHSLNLVITQACTEPAIRNCISVMKGLTIFIKSSPKCGGLLKEICTQQQQVGTSGPLPC